MIKRGEKMSKKLSEMSLEELWQLFPIFLTPHRNEWEKWYQEEETFLKSILDCTLDIYHIGSTSIKNIWAKPIIDILVDVPITADLILIKEILIQNGYTCMNEGQNRFFFNKGYTEQGFAQKVFHLHLRYNQDHDELYFRDYLNEHENIAHEYEKLKLMLWKKYEHNRDGYTNAKTEFIQKYTHLAKIKYKGRYE